MTQDDKPYNPLDKRNLGESVADGLLQRDAMPLPLEDAFVGAGIYAIYYTGAFPLYQPIAAKNQNQQFGWPIYIGKAIPPGGRRGGMGVGEYKGKALYQRINEHARSIDQAANLEICDFFCRYLIVDDIWIPLGESLLIEKFNPLWNRVLDGFGNHDPGKGRYRQEKSAWDAIHPGRAWAEKCAAHKASIEEIEHTVSEYYDSV